MEFCVLTPSFRSAATLKGCLASVFAQAPYLAEAGIGLHHHVQDAGKCERVGRILEQHAQTVADADFPGFRFTWERAEDRGMYDALNRAFAATSGSLIGHLNADEQYQPRALRYVVDWFALHPNQEILFGATVITRADGTYICTRFPLIPQRWHTQVCHLNTLTASMFYRRSAIQKLGFYFNPAFRYIGDADLVLRMLDHRLSMGLTRNILSLFILSGENISLHSNAQTEAALLRTAAPTYIRRFPGLVALAHRIRKLRHGAYHSPRFEYVFIDTHGHISTHQVLRPTARWKT